MAEEVDGLARVADQEDGLRVAVPGFGEHFDEVVLAGGGILHLVDEQVLKACAKCCSEIVRAGFFVESVTREQAEFGEVALVVGGEDELEFDESAT